MDMLWKKAIENGVSKHQVKELEHSEHEKSVHESRFHSKFTMEQVEHIAVMVREDVLPDGTYSDDECSLWVTLQRVFHNRG